MALRTYTVTVTERDATKARQIRTMLRNYGGREVLPGLFTLTLTPTQYAALTAAYKRLRVRPNG